MFHNALEARGLVGDYAISDRAAPPPAVRQEFEARRRALIQIMQPSDKLDMAEVILGLFDAYPSVKMDKAKSQSVAKKYIDVIGAIPLWAVLQGRDEMLRRDLAFPPSAGELRAAAERAADSFRQELAELTHIVEAKVYTEVSAEARERMKVGINALLADLRRANGMVENAPRKAPDARDTQKPLSDEDLRERFSGEIVISTQTLRDQLAGKKAVGEGRIG